MAGGVFQDWVTNQATGAVIPGATVTVRDEVSGALSTIYSNSALSAPLSNPITADSAGFVRFYAAAGLYRIEAVSGPLSATMRSVPIGDAQARDAGVATSAQLISRGDADARYLATDDLNVRLGTTGNLGEAATYDVGFDPDDLVRYEDIQLMIAEAVAGGSVGTMAIQDADAVDITGGTAILDALYVAGDSFFGGDPTVTGDDYSLHVDSVASAVNHVTVAGAVTTGAPSVAAEGTDTNINLRLVPKGTGQIQVPAGGVRATSASGGVGYGTGAGSTVTQATNKSTGVTLNAVCGQITMHNASLAASTSVGFTLTNSAIAATDVVIINIATTATNNAYTIVVDAVAAGSCHIHLRNVTAGALAQALVLNFAVIKAVAA